MRISLPTIVALLSAAGAASAQEPPAAQPEQPAAQPTEPPPPPPPTEKKGGSPITVSYDKGTLFKSEDGNFELKLNGKLQTRFELDHSDTIGSQAKFMVTRARLGLEGSFFKDTTYKIDMALSDQGDTLLKDFYINQAFAEGKAQLRVGLWKKAFNRQNITSDFALEFLERAQTNTFLGGGHDIGVAFHNGYEKSPEGLEWIVALVNGGGEKGAYPTTCTNTMPPVCSVGGRTTTPVDFQPQLLARVGWNSANLKGYSEADLEGGPLRWGVAAEYRGSNLQDSAAAPIQHVFLLDGIAKVEGFDVNFLAFLIKNTGIDAKFGFHVQAGYFVTPKAIEVGARFAMVPVTAASDDNTLELRGLVAWYFKGHNLKTLLDAGILKDTTDGAVTRFELRAGAQIVF